MNTTLLNRAIANRSLSRDQEKAIFAKQGGGFWSKARSAVSQMGRLPTPQESLAKLESDQRGRDALVKTALSLTPVGAGVAIGDLVHGQSPGEMALATLGALPVVGGLGDDVLRTTAPILKRARSAVTGLPANGMVHPERAAIQELQGGIQQLKDAAVSKYGYVDEATSEALRVLRSEENAIRMQRTDDLWAHSGPPGGGPDPFADVVKAARDRVAARLRAERAARPGAVAERSGRYDAATQAQRDELARQLRQDRERKRWDLHPETFFGNRAPLRSDQIKAMYARKAAPGGRGDIRLDPVEGFLPPKFDHDRARMPEAPAGSSEVEKAMFLDAVMGKKGVVTDAGYFDSEGGFTPHAPTPGAGKGRGSNLVYPGGSSGFDERTGRRTPVDRLRSAITLYQRA